MTPEEINALFESAVDPDKAPSALTALKAEFGRLTEANAKLTADNQEATKKIADLRDDNIRLYLMKADVGGGKEQSTTPEEQEKELDERLRQDVWKFLGYKEDTK